MLGYYLIYSAGEYCAPKWLRSIIEVREVDMHTTQSMTAISGNLRVTPNPLPTSTLAFTSSDSSQRGSIKVRQVQVLPLGKNPYHVGRLAFPISTTITITSFPEMGKKVNWLEIHTLQPNIIYQGWNNFPKTFALGKKGRQTCP